MFESIALLDQIYSSIALLIKAVLAVESSCILGGSSRLLSMFIYPKNEVL